jgi:hypothetical protein
MKRVHVTMRMDVPAFWELMLEAMARASAQSSLRDP